MLCDTLWMEESLDGEHLFAILDGARDPRIFGAVDASRQDKCCLWSATPHVWPGDGLSWKLIGVAPYLVEMEKDTPLTNIVLKEGWPDHWGIFIRSDASMDKLRRHFRSLLTVRNESDRLLLFRYYDPRVLRRYLPTCRREELSAVFGPVSAFVLPAEDPDSAIEHRFDGQRLLTRALS